MSDDKRSVIVVNWTVEISLCLMFVSLWFIADYLKDIRDDYRTVHGIVEKKK